MHAAQHTDACSASKGQFNVKYTGYAQGDGAEAFMRHANAARGILKFLGRAKHFAHLDQLGLSHNRSALRATVTTLSRKIRHATRVMKMCTKELLVVMEKYNVNLEVILQSGISARTLRTAVTSHGLRRLRATGPFRDMSDSMLASCS